MTAAPVAMSTPPPTPASTEPAASASASNSETGGTGIGQTGAGLNGRQTFAGDELAIVLSHYDLGVIEQIKEFPRGSRKAPKLMLRAERGDFLLKRRARGKEDAYKVAFCHAIQLHLTGKQFPLPHLIGTRRDNNSMLQLNDTTYELFEYIKGSGYDSSLEATHDAGKVLSLFHKLLKDFKSEYEPARGSYHAARSVVNAVERLPATIGRTDPAGTQRMGEKLPALIRTLAKRYASAARAVQELGFNDWPQGIVHSDWHPGNMLFRGKRVVAVIDYDTARIQQRVLDAGNGALQFSILGGSGDPRDWPEYVDESRFRRFLMGYDAVPDHVLTRAELRAIPPLMIEALIAEAVIPIAATGNFARMNGIAFLHMVERKVAWLVTQTDHLVESVDQ